MLYQILYADLIYQIQFKFQLINRRETVRPSQTKMVGIKIGGGFYLKQQLIFGHLLPIIYLRFENNFFFLGKIRLVVGTEEIKVCKLTVLITCFFLQERVKGTLPENESYYKAYMTRDPIFAKIFVKIFGAGKNK